MVPGDPEELLQLFANLVNNAVKYSHDDGVVDLALRGDGDQVVFTCADQGLGMSTEDRERLFGEFFRSPTPRHAGGPGPGWGWRSWRGSWRGTRAGSRSSRSSAGAARSR